MSLKTSTITNIGSKNVAISNLKAFTLIPNPSGIKKWRVKNFEYIKEKTSIEINKFYEGFICKLFKE